MSVFHFKHFSIFQDQADLKVGTDAMLLGAFSTFASPNSILDIGTGTGVLSLMMAQKYPKCTITALEINPTAFELANYNFDNNQLGKYCSAQLTAVQDFKASIKFDGIISNPPYFEESLKNNSIGKSLARHTDSLSFDALFSITSDLLSETGSAWFIIPYLGFNRVQEIIQSNDLFIKRLIEVEGKPENKVRVIIELGKQQSFYLSETFVIRDEDNKYTEEYVELTKDFHNKSLR